MEFGLKGHRIAIVATDGVEQVELVEPRKALDSAGALTEIVAPKAGTVQAFNHRDKGEAFPVDAVLGQVHAARYDALFIPGGATSADSLRRDSHAVQFVREFMVGDKPVAAICHGACLLVEADAVAGRTLTSAPTLQAEIRDAKGEWVDREVVVDDKLITSRKPADLPAFNAAIVREFGNRLDEAKVDSLSEQSFPASDPPPSP